MKLKDIQVVNGLLFALDVEGQLWMRDGFGKWHEEPGPVAVKPDGRDALLGDPPAGWMP